MGEVVKWCEAMVLVSDITRTEEVWSRCGRRPTELHHRLTRARGGIILDKAGETYHLINLCPYHHKIAHDHGQAFESGLLLEGYVITGADGRPEYKGPDVYLSEMYP